MEFYIYYLLSAHFGQVVVVNWLLGRHVRVKFQESKSLSNLLKVVPALQTYITVPLSVCVGGLLEFQDSWRLLAVGGVGGFTQLYPEHCNGLNKVTNMPSLHSQGSPIDWRDQSLVSWQVTLVNSCQSPVSLEWWNLLPGVEHWKLKY